MKNQNPISLSLSLSLSLSFSLVGFADRDLGFCERLRCWCTTLAAFPWLNNLRTKD